MPKALWNGKIVAESDNTKVVEGNHYFPPDSIRKKYFRKSNHHSVCFWKGIASYYHIEVDGKVNENAAWYYPHPSFLAKKIKNYVAFWNAVDIEE